MNPSLVVRGLALLVVTGGVWLAGPGAASARTLRVTSGPLEVIVHLDPWRLSFVESGRSVLSESTATSAVPAGSLGFGSNPTDLYGGSTLTPAGSLWWHTTRALSAMVIRGSVLARVATNDPLGRELRVTVASAGSGVIAVHATFAAGAGPGAAGVTEMADGFASDPGEHFSGFGGRYNGVDQAGGTVQDWAQEGPWVPGDWAVAEAVIPPWTFTMRRDGAYFPMPWLVSSHGYGFLLDDSQLSLFRLRSEAAHAWSVEVDNDRLDYRVFAGPQPLDVVRRFSAVIGRQPAPMAPWELGPWWDAYGPDAAGLPATMRREDVPGSEIQTYTHYLPCGAQVGNDAGEKAMVAHLHALGYAVTTYFNPFVCVSYRPVYDEAENAGAFIDTEAGTPYVFEYVGNVVSEFDFSTQAARTLYAKLLGEAIANGYDGWMEDYGEYTPPDAVAHNGMPGTALHNLYPTLYHCAVHAIAVREGRPIVEYDRSGYVGSAPCQPVVWSGDPTTDWGFDGLPGVVREAINYGYSGIGIFGSDIGGYRSISAPPTTPELLIRWLEFGTFSGIMRTMAEGTDLHAQPVAQIWDPDVLPTWREYAKLRTQLYPYLATTIATYESSGVPPMEGLGLAYPSDPASWTGPERYLFGPDLLVAPVTASGVRQMSVPVPPGHWRSFWQAVTYQPRDGSFHLRHAALLTGGRSVTLRTPVNEIPLLVKAGTLLALLPADVATLASYGKGIVHLNNRAHQFHLLAWPYRASHADALGTRLRSTLHAWRWTLTIAGHPATIDVEAALPWKPATVTWKGRPLPPARWRYRAGVLHVAVRGAGTLTAPR